MKGTSALFRKLAKWFFVSSTIIVMFVFWMIKLPVAIAANAGDLDLSFGTNGVVTTLISNVSSNARGVAIQPDGKIVVAGTVYGSSSGIFVARYNSNGSPDTGFGAGGVVTTYFGEYFSGSALVLQPDGKILVAGSVNNDSGNGIIVARYTSNGSLDTSFGAGGVVTTYLEAEYFSGSALVLQPDGKIVVAGSVDNGSSSDILVARYNSTGSLDTSFGTGGWVITDIISEGISGGDRGSAVAIQLDGKILVAGSSLANPPYGTEYFAVVRYNSNGSLDTSFGAGGMATTHIVGSPDSRNYCWSMALQPDGRIVLGGFLNEVFSEGNDIALARFTPDGALDSSFNGDEMVTTHIEGHFTVGLGIALQPDGKIVVTGYDAIEEGFKTDILVARYNQDGSLDTEFWGGGIVTTEINGGSAYGFAVAIQSDGKIVVAGGAKELNSSQSEIVVVRYIGAATLSIADILNSFDVWVSNGQLIGSGPGQSGPGRLNALRNMISSAGEMIDQGRIAEACVQLQDAYNRCDGFPQPPDFASGQAAPDLAKMIRDSRGDLGCQ
jgi:uncharacterized delta-60 repeat protein